MKRFLLFLVASLFACDSSRQSSAGGEAAITFGQDPAAAAIAQSTPLKAAQAAIDQGHPWRATQLVAPVLRDAHQRTPAALLVAARAAAGWGGWQEVEKLIAKESWLDAEFDGEGRELLTRSALERGADPDARSRAAAALRDAKSEPVRAVRLTLLARAFERNNFFDSASTAYALAAETLRPVRDWLFLRAAGSEVDSVQRGKLFAKVSLAPAKPRIAWTEAQARERFSDAVGAASRFATLGATVQSLRLRLSVAPDTASRDIVKGELLAVIRAHPNTADARSAVDVLDRGFTSFSPGEELVIGRGTATNTPARAVVAFARALTAPALVTPSDRLQYAQALARVGRTRDALSQLQSVQGPLAGQAAYQRASCTADVGGPRRNDRRASRDGRRLSRGHGSGKRGALSARRPCDRRRERRNGARSLSAALSRLSDERSCGERAVQRGNHRSRWRQRRSRGAGVRLSE